MFGHTVFIWFSPRGSALKADAARIKAAEIQKEEDADDLVDASREQGPGRAPADKSSNTRWAQPSKKVRGDTLWHGYPYAGKHARVSYCGLEYKGSFRRSPPPRDDSVCQICAAACKFVRRSSRSRGAARQRGSRRLGSLTDRLEAAVDASAKIADRLEAATKVAERIEVQVDRLEKLLDGDES